MSVSWGTTFLATRIAIESFPPLAMAGTRHVLAGVILAAIVRMRGIGLPPRGSWGMHALLGVLMISVGNGSLVWAQQFVPSGVAAVMVSVIPFWMVGIEAWMPGGEPMRPRQFLGLLLGFGGIVLLASSSFQSSSASARQLVLGVIALQSSCLGWAIGSAYSRRHKEHENVFAGTALQMIFGGGVLMILSLATGEWMQARYTLNSAMAVLYLIVIGSFVGYASYVYALRHLPVATVSLYAYVNPVIAVILGALILGEPLTPRMLVAIAIIFAAMLIVRWNAGTSRSS